MIVFDYEYGICPRCGEIQKENDRSCYCNLALEPVRKCECGKWLYWNDECPVCEVEIDEE